MNQRCATMNKKDKPKMYNNDEQRCTTCLKKGDGETSKRDYE